MPLEEVRILPGQPVLHERKNGRNGDEQPERQRFHGFLRNGEPAARGEGGDLPRQAPQQDRHQAFPRRRDVLPGAGGRARARRVRDPERQPLAERGVHGAVRDDG